MWTNNTIEWIDIELTSFCDIKCPGCFRQIKKEKVSHVLDNESLSFSQLKKWISKKHFPNLKLLNFCGSIDEPSLHPEILEIVDYFSEHYNINISTYDTIILISFLDIQKHYLFILFTSQHILNSNTIVLYITSRP